MRKRTRFRSIALGLTLAVAACAHFHSVEYRHHYDDGPLYEANVAVLVDSSGPDMVIMAEGRDVLWSHDDDGFMDESYTLPFDIRVMTAGPDLEIWAVGTDNKVYKVQYDATGSVTDVSAGFTVPTGVEDIAVSLDGENIYTVTQNFIYRHSRTGSWTGAAAMQRANAWVPSSSTAQRVAVDSSTGHVYTLERLTADWGGTLQTVFRYTRFNTDLSSPSFSEAPINDGLVTLYDFVIVQGDPVWERGTGWGSTRLEYVDGTAAQDSVTVNYSNAMRAGSLGTAGARNGIAGCGSRLGGVLWRARNNTLDDMLEKHTICEN